MRKRSRLLSEISESDRWWDCRMELIVEWTFEGSLKSQESMACREPDPLPTGVYVSTCKRTVELLKLSGTARMIYRLNPKWDWGFFYSFAIKKTLICTLRCTRKMSQATTTGARMCQGTFYLTSFYALCIGLQ